MDIYAFAMKMEKDGEDFYRELSQKARNKSIGNILEMLADDEVKHFKAIKAIQGGPHVMRETAILSNAKNIFERLRGFGETLETEADELALYRQALKIEKQSEDFYLDRADQVQEPGCKDLFLQLAAEEKKHYYLLENILEFISRPKYWLENAEFFHLEDY